MPAWTEPTSLGGGSWYRRGWKGFQRAGSAEGLINAADSRSTSSRWVALGVLSLGWGTRGVATRAAFERGVGALTLVGIRLAIASLIVVGVRALLRNRPRIDHHVLRVGAVMAVTNVAVPFWAFTVALQHASAGFVGLMAALTPLSTALIGHQMLPDEPLNARRGIGMLLGFTGVGVLLAAGDSGLATGGQPYLAVAWSVPGITAFSFSTVYARQAAASIGGLNILVVQFTIGAALALVPMLIFEGIPGLGIGAWALLGYLAVASTVLPLLLFYWVLIRSSAGQASLVGYLVPVVSVVAGIVLLGERAQPGLLMGGTAILAGVVVADWGQGRPRTRPA